MCDSSLAMELERTTEQTKRSRCAGVWHTRFLQCSTTDLHSVSLRMTSRIAHPRMTAHAEEKLTDVDIKERQTTGDMGDLQQG